MLKFCYLFFFAVPLFSLVDLEKSPHEFVLETKKIELEKYPDAFNPSIIRWRGNLLLSFRIRDPETLSTNQVGFTWLDENFDPIGSPGFIHIPADDPFTQDPRLIAVGEDLYIVFNNLLADLGVRRMFFSKLYYDGAEFFAISPQLLNDFEENDPKEPEKNWVPFVYQEELLLSYSLNPHRVLSPTENCRNVASTSGHIDWKWGELRGGTQAFIVENCYLAFFHSTTYLTTLQSAGIKMSHYFMGAYIFSLDPPFSLTAVSPEPIVGEGFYNGPVHKTWKPLRVVFPGGFVFDERYVWVSYGRQDHEMWIAKLDKNGLFKSLVPVLAE